MTKTARYTALDGAGAWSGKLYFFIEDRYYRYAVGEDRMDDGFPQSLSAWVFPSGFLSGLDAALNGQGNYRGKAYIFKDAQYLRYDWASGTVDEGYPASLDAWGLPPEFQGGIDAAINGTGQYSGKAYFFKNGSYVRYDWASDRLDEGYPQPISAWNLPDEFCRSLDAAVNAPGRDAAGDGAGKYDGKAWFFSGGRYARYDWAANAMDPGYPADVSAWGLPQPAAAGPAAGLAWGKLTGSEFKAKVVRMAADLGCDPNHLMAAMAFETGESFSPSIVNTVSGATGLIQFMPSTARALGTTTAALKAMSAVNQLDYVSKYFQSYKGKLSSLSDVYMAILWPKAIGKPEGFVLFAAPSVQYTQNKGLDTDGDGGVTKAEASAKVRAKLTKGMGANLFG